MYIHIFSLIMMYILVQYKEDGILQVCNSSQVKVGQNNNIIAKYCDGYFYSCNIICRNRDKYILEEIKKNLKLKLPVILLELDNSTFSNKSLVTSCENENNLIISSEGFVENKFDIPELCEFSNNQDVPQRTNENNTSKKSVAEPSENDENIIISSENSEDRVENEMNSSELHEFANNQEHVQQRINMNNKSSKTINIHQIITSNQWYECIIDANNVSGVHNIVLPIIEDNGNASATSSIRTFQGIEGTVKIHKSSHKRHACFYCKKEVFQISRHLLTVHCKEIEIQQIKQLNANNPLRKSKMNLLRNKGDFEYNKNVGPGPNIVVRATTRAMTEADPQEYIPCPSCLGFFLKNNLRHHKRRCSPHKGDRKLQGEARKLLNHIHNRASDKLRNYVVPNMFHDEVANNFLFDEVLILYGNYLCVKYTQDHLKNHVRAQLRLLGRMMLQAKAQNCSITCCKELIQSIHCDTIRNAIDDVAGLDPVRGTYKHPFNARTLGTALQKIVGVIKSESIKKEDVGQLKICESFLQVYRIDIAPYLNRICALSEKKQKRIKHSQVRLPKNDEIEKYFKYLMKHITFHQQQLKEKFSIEDWKFLAQYLLVALAVFNRKRPGETQRLELEDFNRRQCISQKELYSLEHDDQLQADRYVRVGFGGKLGNSTALLIDKEKILPGLLLMLKFRHKAGVHKNNQFLFGAPSTDENKTFSTYLSHQLFLSKSGLRASSLSFTNLRYHLATEVSKGGPSQEEEIRVSNYMSHDYNIHKSIYDQSAVVMDITKVSKHLEASATVNKRKRVSTVNLAEQDFDDYENLQKPPRKKVSDCEEECKQNCTFANDEPDITEVERCLGKLQNRSPWTLEEKKITSEYFKEYLDNNKSINSEKVRTFKAKYCEALKKRSVPMIKQWLEMENIKKYRITQGIQELRPRYSTPECELLESSTEHHSLSGSEPSLQELDELINENPILKRRTALSLLDKFKRMNKKKLSF